MITYELTSREKKRQELTTLRPHIEYLLSQGYRRYKIAEALGIKNQKDTIPKILNGFHDPDPMDQKRYRSLASKIYWKQHITGWPIEKVAKVMNVEIDFASYLWGRYYKELHRPLG